MNGESMKLRRTAICSVAAIALSFSAMGTARAEAITAAIGDSSITLQTPLYAPGEYECAKYPYTYAFGADVNTASIAIVDAYGTNVASDIQINPGSGSSTLQLCGFTAKDKKPPFVLQLELSYTYDSGKGNQVASSPSFTLTSKGGTTSCKKVKAPNKGQIKAFKGTKCPAGWKKA